MQNNVFEDLCLSDLNIYSCIQTNIKQLCWILISNILMDSKLITYIGIKIVKANSKNNL